MYHNYKILATICVRSGSQGIKDKNIYKINGKPLVAYSIQAAKQAQFIDEVIVSTDSRKYQKIAQKYGAKVPFLRPKYLANNNIGRIAAVIHAVNKFQNITKDKFEIVVDLGNMSPLRTKHDIKKTIDILVNSTDVDVVYTVSPAARNPYYNMVEIDKNGYARLCKKITPKPTCRQQAPKVFDMNDSIYAIWTDKLMKLKSLKTPIQLESSLKQKIHVMPAENSIDVDRPIDLKLLELLIKQQS